MGIAIAAIPLLYLRVVMPSVAASRGFELIKSQDFNNFLAKVGERNADRVADLFNTIITKLHNERLHNLEQENFLNLLIEASPMGVVILDFDHKVASANKAFASISGIGSIDQILGRTLGELPSGIALEMDGIPLGESKIIRQGGVKMWRCQHLHFIQTGFKRHFYLLESLTEEIIAAERKAYEKVIRTMSHEVNNTVGGVKTMLDIMHDIAYDDEETREAIESCCDRCDKLCSFINSYAEVVKIPEPVKQSVDLAEEISLLYPFLKRMAPNGIDLSLNLQQTPVIAAVDMSLMQQALVNIVKNAIESIDGQGFVSIELKQAGRKALIEISNNGAPITKEISTQLFTPFFTTKPQGKGLGLTLISDILKKHGAEFRLFTDSSSITRFAIAL